MDKTKTNANLKPDESSEADKRKPPRRTRLGLRAALVFGIVAATAEMGVILWMARC